MTEFALRTSLFVVFFSVLLGISFSVYFQNRNSWLNRLLALHLLGVCVWQFLGYANGLLLASPDVILPLQMIAGIVSAVLFFYFARVLSSESPRRHIMDYLVPIPGIALCIYYVVRIIIRDRVENEFTIPLATKPGPVAPDYVIYTTILFLYLAKGLGVIVFALFRNRNHVRQKLMLTVVAAGLATLAIIIFINVFFIFSIPRVIPAERICTLVALIVIARSVLGQQAWGNESLLAIIQEKERSLAERNRHIESELDLARLIHHRLFPEKPPRIPGYDIVGACISTDKVGGDFYDFYTRIDNLGIFIADVSGHGIPAAFIASCTKMAFNYSAMHSDSGSQLLRKMDLSISRRSVQSMYVTAVYAEIDYATRVFTYCTAGHCPIFLHRRSDQTITPLKAKGSPLGLMTGKQFEERKVSLVPGDRIVFFTDGLTESIDVMRRPFGEDRFRDLVATNGHLTALELTTKVLEEITNYSGRVRLEDDSTIVVVDIMEVQSGNG